MIAILVAHGYTWRPGKGDHRVYSDDVGHVVLVDMGRDEYGSKEITTMMREMDLDRRAFYGSTVRTAKKIR